MKRNGKKNVLEDKERDANKFTICHGDASCEGARYMEVAQNQDLIISLVLLKVKLILTQVIKLLIVQCNSI
jgi:hypothetical protein